MLLAVASSKRDSGGGRNGGGDEPRASQTKAAISTSFPRCTHATVRVPPKIPKSARNKGLPLSVLTLHPQVHTHTHRHTPSLVCTRRGETQQHGLFSVGRVVCRREHVHGPRPRFDEPRASMRERERGKSLSGVEERVVYSTVIVWLRFFGG